MTLTFKLEIIDRVKVNQQSSVSNVLIKGQLLQKLLMSGHTHTHNAGPIALPGPLKWSES